jgi:hypothetical protein
VVVVEHKQDSEITTRSCLVMVEATLTILVGLMIGMVVEVVRAPAQLEVTELISADKAELVVPVEVEIQIPQ